MDTVQCTLALATLPGTGLGLVMQRCGNRTSRKNGQKKRCNRGRKQSEASKQSGNLEWQDHGEHGVKVIVVRGELVNRPNICTLKIHRISHAAPSSQCTEQAVKVLSSTAF